MLGFEHTDRRVGFEHDLDARAGHVLRFDDVELHHLHTPTRAVVDLRVDDERCRDD